MLQKLEPIALIIKDGDNNVSCENASIFSRRMTWIVKQHANMSYEHWNDVLEVEKDELCSHVWVKNILIMKFKILMCNSIRNFC